MIRNKLWSWFHDSEHELSLRTFVLTSLLVVITLSVIFVWDIFIGESVEKLVVLGAAVVALLVIVWLSVRYENPEFGSIVIAVAALLVVFPVEFFTGGGVYGCTPIWFSFTFMYVGLNIRSRWKYLLFPLILVSAIGCYVIACLYPEILTKHDMKTAYLDSIASLVGVGILLYITMSFLLGIYSTEREIAKKQTKEIAELNQSQNRFFSSMSHEIRTPINTIIGLNEMILREDVSDEVAEDAANIQSASKMLLHLINDILDMSKIDSGQMQLSLAPYHTGDMLSDIVGMLWLRAKEKGLEFHIDVAPELPAELYGDEVRIKQILINVLNNSIKYTKQGSVMLSIQCEKKERGITVIYTVTDTGMGIKKESIPYLFTAFRRIDEEKNRYIEGTGLGLSIVKQLVDLMGGKITVNSVYTKGSTFIIEIPQQIVDDTEIGKLDMEKNHALNRRELYHQSFEAPDARILVVDDNASNLLVVTKLLRDTKVEIQTASSGEEALKKTLDTLYHVIFMDHMMPEMDGIECLHKIRGQSGGLNKTTKVVALTANAGGDMKALYEREGFDGYLLKPVSGEALENELHRLLPKELVSELYTNKEVVAESISWMNEHRKKIAVAITTDSVSDIPKELIEKYHIAVLPHMVVTQEGIFKDGMEIEARGLLSYMEDEKKTVRTVSPDVAAHEAFFAEQLTRANNIIHVSISGSVEHSGYPEAMEAAKVFENVTVFDTGHLSSGEGLMVLEACRMAEAGKTPEEIIERLERMKTQVHTTFIVDSLDFLARAGQVAPGVARMTKVLMVHPVLTLKNGNMVMKRAYLGTKDRSWRKYISSAFNMLAPIDHRILFITYAGLTKRELEEIREEVRKTERFMEIYFQKASPAIAVNCGPGTFGLIFQTEEKRGKLYEN